MSNISHSLCDLFFTFHCWELQRSLVGCSPWGRWESGTTERLHFHFSLSCTGEGNGNPLQCSCLENPRDRGTYWAAVSGVAQRWTWLKWLSSSSSSSSILWILLILLENHLIALLLLFVVYFLFPEFLLLSVLFLFFYIL